YPVTTFIYILSLHDALPIFYCYNKKKSAGVNHDINNEYSAHGHSGIVFDSVAFHLHTDIAPQVQHPVDSDTYRRSDVHHLCDGTRTDLPFPRSETWNGHRGACAGRLTVAVCTLRCAGGRHI